MSKRTKQPLIHRFFGPSSARSETSEDNESFDQSSNSSSSLNESSSSAKRICCSSDAETEKVTQTGRGSEDLPVTVARQNETTLSSSKQGATMMSLPREVLLEISKWLSLEERMIYLAPVCRYLYDVMHDSSLWRTVYSNAEFTLHSSWTSGVWTFQTAEAKATMRCLEKVISADQPDSQRTKIRDLCRTRWVERHEAYETFALLLPSIVKTFEVILDEQQHKQYSTETPWNWDRETLQKANGFYHTCCSFQFLIALIVTMKTLAVIKPISIKLQKKSNDIVKAYCMISDTEKELKEKRDEAEAVFKRWYSNAVELTFREQPQDSSTGQMHPMTLLRNITVAICLFLFLTILHKRCLQVITVTLHKVQQSTNTQILISGYILNCSRFGNTQKTAVQLLGLVPSITVSHTDANIDAVSEMYRSDLPNPQTLDVEYHRWTRKWQSERSQPDALQPALEVCDADIFPNIHCLLRIACTIPVTSADNERANSTLKLVKGYLRTTMTTERLSGLALMNIHHKKPVDYDAVVQKFVEQQPRRMLLADLIFEES
ncbi:unnamed protein product [Porites lobata]|uniref:F-box domain-containing protein n=1 Tax=Porites lobata TaxID=104759 RepID=A0ABN8NT96_9CNID|nr:unnamed protein product [Porites lobata]